MAQLKSTETGLVSANSDVIPATYTVADRIEMAHHFLNIMFGTIPSGQYGYLWLKRGEEKITISFNVSNPIDLQKMAETAINYNDEGYDVYFSVGTLSKTLPKNHRAKKVDVIGISALWSDIDIEGGDAHKKTNLSPDISVAISFLPIKPSIIVHSGHGIHVYWLFSDFQVISDENRAEIETLEKDLLSVIRINAGKYKGIDSVQDLSRVMRLPGTYNHKDQNNPQMCCIIEENEQIYSLGDLRSKIDELLPKNKKELNVEHIQPVELSVSLLSDDEVIEKIHSSKQQELFHQLFDDGDISKYSNDESAADFALLSILPFWTHGNREQMERIFNRSALAKRDKWQEREDYRERTIDNALKSWNGVCYDPNYQLDIEPEKNDVYCELERNERGKILCNTNNFYIILNKDPALTGLLAYDKFSGKMIKSKTPIWDNKFGFNNAWTDKDDAQLRYYISQHYDIRSPQLLNDAIIVVAEQNAFHPVREYLENLPEWDGVERAAYIFINTLEVEDTEYSRIITLCWLKAAVKRVMMPGCKFDYCLVLAGSQGIGKSTVFKKLGGSWFNDSIDNISNKDAIEQLQGSWIIELGEMQATKKADNEAIKAFISRSSDRIRLPYARRAEDFPRQCVFGATTNDAEPLKDKTGGRRFWILKAYAHSPSTIERLSILTEEYIQQVWAEVYHKYKLEIQTQGTVNLLPPKGILSEANDIQEEFTEGSELVDQIKNYLDTLIPSKEIWDSLSKTTRRDFLQNVIIFTKINSVETRITGTELRQEVCSAEVAYELFNIENLNKDKATLREINTILSNLDNWEKLPHGKRMGIYGSQKNVYTRVNPFI